MIYIRTVRLTGLLFCLFFVKQVLAQTKQAVFEFEDELCLYKAYYPVGKFKEHELNSTLALITNSNYFDGIDSVELDSNYRLIRKEFEVLDVIDVPYFKKAKDSIIRAIDESYEIKCMLLKAEDDPEILKSRFLENAEVKRYVDALLHGEEELLKAYEYLIRKQMENNADPESLWEQYHATIRSEDHDERAYDYVLHYGWWNEVNALVYHYSYDGQLVQRFHQIFDKVETIDCDEM